MILTAYISTHEPETFIVCDSARKPGAADHGYRVRTIRAGVTTQTLWHTTETAARELFEKTVEAHNA